jgi:hypothetical protein
MLPSDLELRFRDKYLETGSMTDATAYVGKSRQWGYFQLKKPYMAEALKNRAEFVQQTAAVDLEFPTPNARAKWLESVINGTLTETKTIRDRDGTEFTVEQPFSGRERLKAMQLLGMMSGDYTIKTESKTEHTERRVLVVVPEPIPLAPLQKKELPETIDEYAECKKCGELVSEKTIKDHENTCPGA